MSPFRTLVLSIALELCFISQFGYAFDPIAHTNEMMEKARAKVDESTIEEVAARGQINRYRLPLPSDITNFKKTPNTLKCGGTYAIAKEGYLSFKLNSKSKACYHAFLGSKIETCTSTILCTGKIKLTPASSKGCDEEWFVISDGTVGLMSGCGSFRFANTPRTPRNNGSDLYVYYKGASTESVCLVFCLEDLQASTSQPKTIKPAKVVSLNKRYKGQKMEDSCVCGKRHNLGRIVGGDIAKKFEYPWIAAVVYSHAGWERKPFCGASLINDRYALSAAHCFALSPTNPEDVQLVLHAHVMDKRKEFGHSDNEDAYQSIPGWKLPKETDQSEESIRMDVEEIYNHPLFNEKTFDYDLAIIKLKSKVNLKKGKVAPICLPNIDERFDYTAMGDTLIVSGWGRIDEHSPSASRLLLNLEVPTMELAKCRTYTMASHRHLCAGYVEGGKDSCAGDSGGPIIHKFNAANNQYMLAGVVSAGKGCARKDNMGLYTSTQELIQWVYHNTGDSVWCKRS